MCNNVKVVCNKGKTFQHGSQRVVTTQGFRIGKSGAVKKEQVNKKRKKKVRKF